MKPNNAFELLMAMAAGMMPIYPFYHKETGRYTEVIKKQHPEKTKFDAERLESAKLRRERRLQKKTRDHFFKVSM